MLDNANRIVFVHAHPDDETLATGALIARLARDGKRCYVLTATRGEMGEVTPGPLAILAGTPALSAHREQELARACDALGVAGHAFLGAPPAGGGRRYSDSGMAWIDEAAHIAGPAPDAPPDALTLADPSDVAADIAAYATSVAADAIVSYDAQGGYHHPDHVFLHAPALAAARAIGVPFFEVVSHPEGVGEWHDLAEELDAVTAALACYASQLTVDGTDVVHVGGQRQPIQTRIGLRRR